MKDVLNKIFSGASRKPQRVTGKMVQTVLVRGQTCDLGVASWELGPGACHLNFGIFKLIS